MRNHPEVVGLIPAAGKATRIAPLPCSKELYPIGFQSMGGKDSARAKVACEYLLAKMRSAGITNAYIVLRGGKWDIPAYFGDGSLVGMNIAYLMMGLPFGVPYSLNQAHPFLRHATVAFGFPDILFDSDDAFVQLLQRQATSDADVIIGLLPAERPDRVDMIDFDGAGKVRRIEINPPQTQLQHTWAIAVWAPVFTEYLHDYVSAHESSAENSPELTIGAVFRDAIQDGLRFEGIPVSNEPCLDIGTPENLVRAVARFANQ